MSAAVVSQGVAIGEGGSASESVLVQIRDRSTGGSSVCFLGTPRSGKSALAYLLASQRYKEERTWARGNSDDGWYWWFGSAAVVWTPEGCDVGLLGMLGTEKFPIERVEVRTYASYADLLARAEVGRVHVLYWPGDGFDEWVSFLEALVDREERVPQLVLDDEAHETLPADGTGGGKGAHERVVRFLRVMAHARRAEVSFLLCTHQGFDVHYAVLGKCHFTILLAGSRVPPYLPDDVVPTDLLYRIAKGQGIAVGPTDYGTRWTHFFIPAPPPRRFSVVVRVKGRQVGSTPPPLLSRFKDHKPSSRKFACSDCGHAWASTHRPKRCPRQDCRGYHVAPESEVHP